MSNKSATFIRVLGNYFHKGPVDVLLKKMPKEDAEAVLSTTTASQDITAPFRPPQEWIERIHYSWFVPIIAEQVPSRQNLLIAALPLKYADRVRKILRKSRDGIQLSPPLLEYLQRQM